MSKKVLVTGGAGFIGSHLVSALLREGYEVVVIDKLLHGNKIPEYDQKYVNLINEDVRNANIIDELSIGCDYIFHFAAVLGVDVVAENPIETMETETIGMKNVADASVKHNVSKIIYASTSGVYGHSAIEKSVSEEIQLDPRTSYSIAKRFNEIYLAALHEERKINTLSLRFFNVYGKGQDERMVIPRFIKRARENREITVYGNGLQTRDFTFVEDTIKSILLLTEKVEGTEVFNIANEKEVTILELAEIIKIATGSFSEISLIDAPAKRYDFEVERRIGCSEKLFKAIGYRPETPLLEGLQTIL